MFPVTYSSSTFSSRTSRTSGKFAKAGFVSARFVGLLILAVLALLYIAQSSQGATKRIEVQSLRTKADELVTDEGQLKLEVQRLQSLDSVSQAAGQLNLEPVNEVEYLKK